VISPVEYRLLVRGARIVKEKGMTVSFCGSNGVAECFTEGFQYCRSLTTGVKLRRKEDLRAEPAMEVELRRKEGN
jgi:hypothetical protein